MACTLTKGRIEPCKDKIGGIYKVFFANFGTLTGLTYSLTNDSVSGVTDAQLFEYQLKGTSTLAQSMTSSRENGTTMVTQTLTLSLKGLSQQDNFEIKNPYLAIEHLAKDYDRVIAVTGDDRVNGFIDSFKRYEEQWGIKFDVVSAGARHGDTEAEQASGTRVRAAALAGDYEAFSKYMPSRADQGLSRYIYHLLRKRIQY